MSLLPILLLLGALVGPSFQELPSYTVSKLFQDSIYFLSKTDVPFNLENTNQLCKNIGGYLVEIDSVEEQFFVADFVEATTSSLVMTGETDAAKEGLFVHFNSQKPMPALKWKSGNPDNWGGNPGEDCMNINRYGINDLGCDRTLRYLCELKVVS
ncbi:collectin sub-family member 12 [Plakobranchus ocellatus]|uniref:Collectin sub-family member 12 n=1 Tax=Plakobranchus ocellatus TaxID=259542 RepID=A0AAV4ACU1_9GAST|nr:collectin sub-family member 12 [Plakobranchus ocellatus]